MGVCVHHNIFVFHLCQVMVISKIIPHWLTKAIICQPTINDKEYLYYDLIQEKI